MIKRRSLLLCPALLLALATGAFASDIMVMNAMAPKSLTPSAKSAAIYLMLMNHGSASDTLSKTETPVADHAMAHQTVEEDGVMKMREVEGLELKAGDMITFAPGGYHIMLTGLKAPLKVGDSFPLTLTFKSAGPVQVDVKVVDKVEGSAKEHDHSTMTSD
jgi:periplasmic copper chaperone A